MKTHNFSPYLPPFYVASTMLDSANSDSASDNVGRSVCRRQILSDHETLALNSLVSYAAFKTGRAGHQIERRMTDHFHVDALLQLPPSAYDDAVRFLIKTAEFIQLV